MLLMCTNKAVYDIDRDKVMDRDLLPGLMYNDTSDSKSYTFKKWLKIRYSSNTNTLARHLRGIAFSQGNRVRIDKQTHALSLSDNYWIKDENDNVRFEEISPYYSDFWNGDGEYKNESVPTLYVGGYLNKEWTKQLKLNKYGKETQIEYECYKLCEALGIECARIEKIYNAKYGVGITVDNITNTKVFLEQADMSGLLDPENFTYADIVELFELSGIQMIMIDTIIGNGDRHAGNFGFIRDVETGDYLGQAPLYDFDHALDATGTNDVLINDFVDVMENNAMIYKMAIMQTLEKVEQLDINEVFKRRANEMIKRLNNY